jgi:hypothetical protein
VNACGEHVNPESTCTIRLCLWKQESPDFRQGRVQIYSRGIYEQLPLVELKGKAIIRIHNLNDKKWYPNTEEGKLILFFDDLKLNNLSLIN